MLGHNQLRSQTGWEMMLAWLQVMVSWLAWPQCLQLAEQIDEAGVSLLAVWSPG